MGEIHRREYVLKKMMQHGAPREVSELVADHTNRICDAMFEAMTVGMEDVPDPIMWSVAGAVLVVMKEETRQKIEGIKDIKAMSDRMENTEGNA